MMLRIFTANTPRGGPAWLGILAATLLNVPAVADTFLAMRSQPGDFVGQGEVYYFTEEDGAFTAEHSFGHVFVRFKTPLLQWTLLFDSPKGTELAPGPYENAARLPPPTQPGLDVGGGGRGCNRATGRFVVLQASYADWGRVESFAADFEQRCEDGSAALFGTVSFNSVLPLPPRPLPTPTPDPESTYLLLDSEAGEFIGSGLRQRLSNAEGDLTVTRSFGYLLGSFLSPESDRWTVELAAPAGKELRPGVYVDAERFPFQNADQPGLDVSGSGRACNTLTGTFVIHYSDHGPGNEVARLAADFEQHCGGDSRALRGALRVHSSLPPGACAGDCDGDRTVSIDELITGVNIVLGQLAANACPALDLAGEGRIGIDALIRAVNLASSGCIGPHPE